MGGGKMEYFLDKMSRYQSRLEDVNEDLMIEIYWGSNDGCFKCSISKWNEKNKYYVPVIAGETIEELLDWLDDTLENNPKYLAKL